jgi:hypothetical protein
MKITYDNSHFDEHLNNLKELLKKDGIEIELNKYEREPRIYALATFDIYDIVVYISEHKLELIIGGLGGNLVSNLIWKAIDSIWTKITSHKFHILQSSGLKEREGNVLLVVQVKKDKEINFKLSSDFKQELISETVDKLNQFITNESADLIDSEDNFATDNNGKKIFRVRFDPENKVWTAVPLTDNEKRMRELRKFHEKPDKTKDDNVGY